MPEEPRGGLGKPLLSVPLRLPLPPCHGIRESSAPGLVLTRCLFGDCSARLFLAGDAWGISLQDVRSELLSGNPMFSNCKQPHSVACKRERPQLVLSGVSQTGSRCCAGERGISHEKVPSINSWDLAPSPTPAQADLAGCCQAGACGMLPAGRCPRWRLAPHLLHVTVDLEVWCCLCHLL